MKANSLHRLLAAGLVAVGMLAGASATSAAGFSRIVTFGDSLSDPGNAFVLLRDVEVAPFELIPDAPYARGGLHFSNGATWIEQLAGGMQLAASAGPALRASQAFSNYAVGAARARVEGPFDVGTQVNLFLEDSGGSASADALYVVFAGGNDLRDALNAGVLDPSGATSLAIVQAAVTAIRDNLLKLYAAGARSFLVANAPNLALVPAVRMQGPLAQGAAQALAVGFNGGLAAVLAGIEASLPVTIKRFDVYSILGEVVAAPGAAGLSEVEQPCITPGTLRGAFCTNPDSYLFWDGIHPTRAGHAILAQRAATALAAP